MTSQINEEGIDVTFPIAGRDNSSQGFRNNFQSTYQNFQYARQEISDLQSKAMLLSALSGNTSAITNNLAGTAITNASLIGTREFVYDIGNYNGSLTIDFANGIYQTVTLNGSVTIANFTNFPTYPNLAPGQSIPYQARIRLEVIVLDTDYLLTLPTSVTLNYENIAGITGRTIQFSGPGSYQFEFSSNDGGVNISVQDLNRNLAVVDTSLTVLANLSGVAVGGVFLTSNVENGQIVGNVRANNIIAENLINIGTSLSLSGNVTAGNLIANTAIYGTLGTNVQPNITLVGTLSSLSVSANANVGNLTVTGYTDMCGGTGFGVQYLSAVNSGTSTLYSNVGFVVINPSSSTISSHTVVMPGTYSSPRNGQAVTIAFGNTVTTVTQSGAGSDTIVNPITTGNTSQTISFIYYKNAAINSGNGVWYRIV